MPESISLPVWVLITALLAYPVVTTAISIWLTGRANDRRIKVEQAASVKVEQVRLSLLESSTKVVNKLSMIEEGQKEIHTLVNSRLTAALNYISKLEILLREATGRPMQGELEAAEKRVADLKKQERGTES